MLNRMHVLTENRQALLLRWKWANSGANEGGLALLAEDRHVLGQMSEDQVKRAAEVDFPLFQISHDRQFFEGLLTSLPEHTSPWAKNDHIADSEETIVALMGRWAAVRQDPARARGFYAMSKSLVDWLAGVCTQDVVRAAVSAGSILRLGCSAQYLWSCAQNPGMSRAHRNGLLVAQPLASGPRGFHAG